MSYGASPPSEKKGSPGLSGKNYFREKVLSGERISGLHCSVKRELIRLELAISLK